LPVHALDELPAPCRFSFFSTLHFARHVQFLRIDDLPGKVHDLKHQRITLRLHRGEMFPGVLMTTFAMPHLLCPAQDHSRSRQRVGLVTAPCPAPCNRAWRKNIGFDFIDLDETPGCPRSASPPRPRRCEIVVLGAPRIFPFRIDTPARCPPTEPPSRRASAHAACY